MTEGLGRTIKFQTTSDTVEIAAGRMVTRDGSGDVLATTVPGVDNPMVGVSATKVASRSVASQKNIVVQVSGMVSVPKPTDLEVFAGAMMYCMATTTTVGTGSGSTCLEATQGTTLAAGYAYIGRAAYDATTADANVIVNLQLEGA